MCGSIKLMLTTPPFCMSVDTLRIGLPGFVSIVLEASVNGA